MPLFADDSKHLTALNSINEGFSEVMERAMANMWASKLGLADYDHDLLIKLLQLMVRTGVDYSLFFHELSALPDDVTSLTRSFYHPPKTR